MALNSSSSSNEELSNGMGMEGTEEEIFMVFYALLVVHNSMTFFNATYGVEGVN
jgi:hypothetical protein